MSPLHARRIYVKPEISSLVLTFQNQNWLYCTILYYMCAHTRNLTLV